MDKRYMPRIAKFIALLLPVAIAVLVTQHYWFSFADQNTSRLRSFYNEEENSLDVILLGACEVFTDFSPAYAYEKYGFTSYPYSIEGNPAGLLKSELKEILKRQNPELIIIEVNDFVSEEAMSYESRLEVFTESTPMSLNAIEAVIQSSCKDKLCYLLPFIKYHGDWTNREALYERFLQTTYRADQPTLLKGALTCTSIDKEEPIFDVPTTNDTRDLIPEAEACLLDFLEYCKMEQLDNVIFIRFPHKFVDEDTYHSFFCANRVGEIVAQYGYPLINLEQKADEIGIDYMNDFYIPHNLNFHGQKKLTDYLGNLIMNQYHLTPMEQTEKNKAQWEEAALYTKAYYDYLYPFFENNEEVWMQENKWMKPMLDHFMATQNEADRT